VGAPDQAALNARWRNTWSRSRGAVAKGRRVVKWSDVIFSALTEYVRGWWVRKKEHRMMTVSKGRWEKMTMKRPSSMVGIVPPVTVSLRGLRATSLPDLSAVCRDIRSLH
jgi:hypothetical protein